MASKQYLTEGAILQKERRMIEKLEERASQLEVFAKNIQQVQKEANAEKVAEKLATLTAMEEVSAKVLDMALNTIFRACISTKEFNYKPYISHLLVAVRKNIGQILNIKVSPLMREPRITVNLEVLGGIEMWANAVKAVDSRHSWGKSRGAPITEWATKTYPDEDIYVDMATRMWAEKIYGVDREGKKIIRVTRTKKGEKRVNVTKKYRGKYESTIRERLSLIPDDKAPFWYLIQYGNASAPGFREGEPYPVIQPVDMIDEIGQYALGIFQQTRDKYIEKAQEIFLEEFYRRIGAKRKAKSFFQMDETTRADVETYLKNTENIPTRVTETGRTIIGEINNNFVYTTTTGTFVVQPRVKGRFAKIGA